MKKTVLFGVALAAATQLFAIQGTVETTAGDSKAGDIKWQARSKSYLLTYKKGKTDVSAEFPLADVAKLDIAVPPGYEKSVEMVEKGQGAQAIATLTKIAADYRMLVWDKPAGCYLAKAYTSAGQPQKALEVCQGIILDDKAAAYSGALAPAYWEALLKLGKRDTLVTLLDKAAASGDRPSSAAALVARGDLIMAEGKSSADACKQALTDGYLRVVLLYADADCKTARKDALEKAATALDTLGKASQAEQYRTQAKSL